MRPSARHINIVLGAWLFLSAFLWPHGGVQFINTWVSGLVCAVAAMLAMSNTNLRYVNTALGAWLIISSLVLPRATMATTWHNLILGVAIGLVSIMSGEAEPATRDERRTTL